MCDRSDAGIRQRNGPIIVIRDGYRSNQCWLLRSQNFTNEAMRPMMSSPVSNGACPSSGTSTTSRPVWCARIASTVAADSRSELPPRITMTGTRANASNSFQRVGRLCVVGCLERGGQLHIEIGDDASAGLPERPARERSPVVVAQFGELGLASAGLGHWTHRFMAYLNNQAGIDQINVIYRSGAEMLTSLLRNDADTAIITISTALGQIKEGNIRALAGAAMRPMPQLPDTPPAGQTIPGFDVTVWHGIVGPPAWILHWSPGSTASSTRFCMCRRFARPSQERRPPRSLVAPRSNSSFIKGELKRWPEVVKAAGITAQ